MRSNDAGLPKMGDQIMKTVAHMLILEMLVGAGCLAQTKKTEDRDTSSPPKLERMPEPLEIRFALSAAPPHLRRGATTFLLDPAKGYAPSHQGTNGVGCIVVRSDWQWSDKPFRDDVFWPVCYDAEGSKTLLQDYIYAAELRARGLSVKQVHEEVTKRFGNPAYPNPSRPGVSYMIAPLMRGYTNGPEPVSMNMPH